MLAQTLVFHSDLSNQRSYEIPGSLYADRNKVYQRQAMPTLPHPPPMLTHVNAHLSTPINLANEHLPRDRVRSDQAPRRRPVDGIERVHEPQCRNRPDHTGRHAAPHPSALDRQSNLFIGETKRRQENTDTNTGIPRTRLEMSQSCIICCIYRERERH